MAKTTWTVTIIEYERGWGQRIDEVKEFDDYDKAANFVEEYNSNNTAKTAPDWYMQAEDPKPKQK